MDSNHLMQLNSQLLTYAEAGLPLTDGLRAAAAAARSKSLRTRLEGTAASAEQGEPVSAVLQREANLPGYYSSMIRMGESGGDMIDALRQVAHFLQMRRDVSGAFRTAISYPAALLVTALVIASYITFQLLPTVLNRVQEMHSMVPDALIDRRVVLAFFIQKVVVAILAATCVIACGVVICSYLFPRARWFHRLLLTTPLYQRLFRLYLVYHFSAVTSSLLRAGVPLDEALLNLRELNESPLITEAADACLEALRCGSALSSGLAQVPWFPPSEVKLLGNAEKTEQVDAFLSDLNQRTVLRIRRTETVLQAMEPHLVVLLAALVGTYAICVFIPVTWFFRVVQVGP